MIREVKLCSELLSHRQHLCPCMFCTPEVDLICFCMAEELMLLNCGPGANSLRVPWRARRSNQSVLKKSNPEHSLEGQILKLKLPYFGHLMQRADSLEKTLILGKTESRRRRRQQRMRWLDESCPLPTQWTWVWASFRRQWRTGKPGVLLPMGSQRVEPNLVTEQQQQQWLGEVKGPFLLRDREVPMFL